MLAARRVRRVEDHRVRHGRDPRRRRPRHPDHHVGRPRPRPEPRSDPRPHAAPPGPHAPRASARCCAGCSSPALVTAAWLALGEPVPGAGRGVVPGRRSSATRATTGGPQQPFFALVARHRRALRRPVPVARRPRPRRRHPRDRREPGARSRRRSSTSRATPKVRAAQDQLVHREQPRRQRPARRGRRGVVGRRRADHVGDPRQLPALPADGRRDRRHRRQHPDARWTTTSPARTSPPGPRTSTASRRSQFSRDRHSFGNGDLTRTSNQGLLIVSALQTMQAKHPSAGDTVRLVATLGRHTKLDGVGITDLFHMGDARADVRSRQHQERRAAGRCAAAAATWSRPATPTACSPTSPTTGCCRAIERRHERRGRPARPTPATRSTTSRTSTSTGSSPNTALPARAARPATAPRRRSSPLVDRAPARPRRRRALVAPGRRGRRAARPGATSSSPPAPRRASRSATSCRSSSRSSTAAATPRCWCSPPRRSRRTSSARFREWLVPDLVAATYDGDTPTDERAWIRAHANVVLTNPEMLHMGILPVARPVGHVPPAPALRRRRRAAHPAGRVRQPRRARAAAAPPAVRALRLVAHVLLHQRHDRQPGRARVAPLRAAGRSDRRRRLAAGRAHGSRCGSDRSSTCTRGRARRRTSRPRCCCRASSPTATRRSRSPAAARAPSSSPRTRAASLAARRRPTRAGGRRVPRRLPRRRAARARGAARRAASSAVWSPRARSSSASTSARSTRWCSTASRARWRRCASRSGRAGRTTRRAAAVLVAGDDQLDQWYAAPSRRSCSTARPRRWS